MKTQKPISTISYNSFNFLLNTLNRLFESHVIEDYFFIFHKAETGEKDHYHVWLKPNRQVDTMFLREEFIEPDLVHPDKKPLGVIPFEKSKTEDAILYFQHYKPYLTWKHQSREYHYKKTDFVFCDEDSFENMYYLAFHCSEFAERMVLTEQLRDNQDDLTKLIDNGSIPLSMACSLNAYKNMKMDYEIKDKLNRNGRKGHF